MHRTVFGAGIRRPASRSLLAAAVLAGSFLVPATRPLAGAAEAVATAVKVNFQPARAAVPAGYVADSGAVYGARGDGLTFGWNTANTANTRDRGAANAPDQRYDTLTHLQTGGTFSWQLAVPAGDYTVRIVAGDPSYTNSVYKIDAEGTRVVDGTPTSTNRWIDGTRTVTVTDGQLTITNAAGAANNKLAFLEVTSVATEGSPVLAAVGDIACDPADSQYNGGQGTASACRAIATAALVDTLNPAAIALLGDLQYEDGVTSKWDASFDPAWGRHKAKSRPAPGNHEYDSPGAAGYYDYFGAVAGDPTKGWYSYELGAWHVVALNSNCADVGGCGPGSAQHNWLLTDLAAHPTTCTLAYWHHPRWTSGLNFEPPDMDPFWRALYEAGVDLALAGHSHSYERFAPMDPAGDLDPQGLRQFVVGTGGRNHHGFGNIRPNSEKRSTGTFGILALTLHPDRYDWRFVAEAGKTFTDTGTTACH